MRNLLLFVLGLFIACSTPQDSASEDNTTEGPTNPPADGFNLEGSDVRAIEVADRVMEAMGGRKSWDETRTICWNFFGARELIWDKWTGDVRIDSQRDTTTYLVNINTMEGKVAKKGQEITDPVELAEMLEQAKAIWINDSYWLVMPFKLKDSGVTLSYLREDTTMAGQEADVLELKFENVGVTPQNKYEVWVSKDENLVRQWFYFPTDTSEARMKTPWNDYQTYGNIKLSGNRGERGLSNIMVLGELPRSVFESLNPVDIGELSAGM